MQQRASGAQHADAPYYLATGDEVAIFNQCHARKLAVMLKGPTCCGKTRFVEYMAWRLGRPLVTISCHDDLTASDLVGRFLIRHDGTAWRDGPLTRAVREGAICYLDEVVEARQDMRQAVTEDRLQGLSAFCLTIDSQAASYLPKVFGPHQYALLPHPQLLPKVLLDWLRRLVAC